MNTQDVDKMLEDLSTTEKADEMDFVMKRENVKPNETFSADALTEFQLAVNTFINARLLYHWRAKGMNEETPGPGNIKVEVRVTIDDKHYPPLDEERPWFVIDGAARNAGLSN